MSTSNLTAKYRPQAFADVAGQSAIKAILSRAAATDKVAPAYLFSGTRGVGKTTIARIFAKALNCINAPTAEPCNECSNCKQITAGVAVDVVEIDGASNRGIDDARRLKEDIGYAPVECRYKVFIIDEAHMLTKEAFNALLKTLEEPPPRATFIMATTEPHKFPATIISRCQHYIYKMLSQGELVAHLENIMNMEELPFEPGALQIIAKRGAGSVRDSMSLLGQALAMGTEVLREDDVRSFLGLAGQDIFFQLMDAIFSRNLVSVGLVLRQVLDQGLDLGFFLRELTNCWRNMFLLRQAGREALPLIACSDEEAMSWLEWAGKFEPSHIHACWQMTLDGQRRVMTSLEPALALELLLFNLTSLPDLLNLANMKGGGSGMLPPQSQGGGRQTPPSGRGVGGVPNGSAGQFSAQNPQVSESAFSSADPIQQKETARPTPVSPTDSTDVLFNSRSNQIQKAPRTSVNASSNVLTSGSTNRGPRNWEGFLNFVEGNESQPLIKVSQLRLNQGKLVGDQLIISCATRMQSGQLLEKPTLMALDALVREYFGVLVEVKIETNEIAAGKSDKQLRDEAELNPAVIRVMETFSAQMISVSSRKQ